MLSDPVATWLTVLVPLAAVSLPGCLLMILQSPASRIQGMARAILGSVVMLTLLATMMALLHLPVESAWAVVGIAVIGAGWRFRRTVFTQDTWRKTGPLLAVFLVAYVVFAVASVWWHEALPTGDSQKAIVWAQDILANNRLPEYAVSPLRLNRDPVDFYTPGLHALTALVMGATPQPLLSVSLFSIAISLGVIVIAIALAQLVWPTKWSWWVPGVVGLLVVSNYRFLRYLREPGYHYQNVVGELLLFGCLMLVVSLVRQWRWLDFCLLVLTAVTLALSHQFSAFLAAFILLPGVMLLLTQLVAETRQKLPRWYLALGLGAILVVGRLAWSLDLLEKIPHLFTAVPHLLSLTPDLMAYPMLLGTLWIMAGMAGWLIYTAAAWRAQTGAYAWIFVASVGILLALSQGPRWFVDIPPVRALLYAVVPLSITATYFIERLVRHAINPLPRLSRLLAVAALLCLIGWPVTTGVASAYRLDHRVRTNSTLTPALLTLAEVIRRESSSHGAVLVDDYNRRATSWLLLSGQPMYARLAADVATGMQEAKQSELRYRLYLNQLDFEKIFMLPTHPEVAVLLQKHRIDWLAGIQGSSATGLSKSMALREAAQIDDVTLWRVKENELPPLAPTARWLLKPTTLANDIGDDEDTFEHLMASVRATRLSAPRWDGARSSRQTSAPRIPLVFNAGDYVTALWEAIPPTQSYQLLIRLKAPVSSLTVVTSTGLVLPVTESEMVFEVPRTALLIDERGFITVMLHNPAGQDVDLDLIALGLTGDSY